MSCSSAVQTEEIRRGGSGAAYPLATLIHAIDTIDCRNKRLSLQPGGRCSQQHLQTISAAVKFTTRLTTCSTYRFPAGSSPDCYILRRMKALTDQYHTSHESHHDWTYHLEDRCILLKASGQLQRSLAGIALMIFICLGSHSRLEFSAEKAFKQ